MHSSPGATSADVLVSRLVALPGGLTALHVAVDRGDADAVEALTPAFETGGIGLLDLADFEDVIRDEEARRAAAKAKLDELRQGGD